MAVTSKHLQIAPAFNDGEVHAEFAHMIGGVSFRRTRCAPSKYAVNMAVTNKHLQMASAFND
eukprot:1159144-Pelagomonas_calceolata.AAC.1